MKKAKVENQNGIEKEEGILAEYENYIDTYIGEKMPSVKPKIADNKPDEDGDDAGKVKKIDNNKTVTLEDDDGKKIKVPAGFGISEDSETKLEDGVIIEDPNGNQYVFIYVPRTDTVYPTAGTDITEFDSDAYTKIEDDLHTYTSIYRNNYAGEDEYNDSDEVSGLTSTQYEEKKKSMLKSVYENEGFYNGRYESGLNTYATSTRSSVTGIIPLSQANKYPITHVTLPQAQIIANNAYSGTYTSSLMFGIQWDLILKFIETNTPAAQLITEENKNILTEDPRSWGNYIDEEFSVSSATEGFNLDNMQYESLPNNIKPAYPDCTFLTTGATIRNSKKKIYDLAGNVLEYTLENFYNETCWVSRGGDYYDTGMRTDYWGYAYSAVVERTVFNFDPEDFDVEEYDFSTFGFRVSLW